MVWSTLFLSPRLWTFTLPRAQEPLRQPSPYSHSTDEKTEAYNPCSICSLNPSPSSGGLSAGLDCDIKSSRICMGNQDAMVLGSWRLAHPHEPSFSESLLANQYLTVSPSVVLTPLFKK